MPRHWRLIESGPCSASYNMALDEAIASAVRRQEAPPTLRFYCWDRPSLSLGCFQKSATIDLAYCLGHNIPVVRRPTGGRAILHADELTYSFSVRTGSRGFAKGLLESYQAISNAFSSAFRKLGLNVAQKNLREKGRVLTRSPLCFESASYGEILINGRKIMGSAQKRWKDGLLQQGSVPYSYDQESMRNVFRTGKADQENECMTSLKDAIRDFDADVFKQAARLAFEETFGISLAVAGPLPEELGLARELEQEKYLQDSWNLRL